MLASDWLDCVPHFYRQMTGDGLVYSVSRVWELGVDFPSRQSELQE